MTREMNKPYWEVEYWHKRWNEEKEQERVLNPLIAEFFEAFNRSLGDVASK